jgi:DNA-binding NarL/FixJ family response regulator
LPDVNLMIARILLAETCAFLGDAHRAAQLYTLLLPFAARNVRLAGTPVASCLGSVERYLGLLAGTMARAAADRGAAAPAGWDEAQAHFEAALAFNANMGARPFVAQTQHDYAAMLVARGRPGDRTRAQELLAQALVTARDLGMSGLEAQALAAREQCDRAVLSTDHPARYPDGLSAREVEVLRLVAAGKTNREIAAALVLSVLTVQNHLAHIYAKIDARSRTDATAYAFHRGLVTPADAVG